MSASTVFNVHPYMELRFGETGVPTRTVFEGYGGLFHLSENEVSFQAGEDGYIVYPFSLTSAGLQPTPPAWKDSGEWYASSAMVVSGLPGRVSPLICRPVHDTRKDEAGDWYQKVEATDWNLYGHGGGYDPDSWEYRDSDYPPRMVYRKMNMGSPDDGTYMRSKFNLPTQPLFSVFVRKCMPTSEEDWDYTNTEQYYAYVKFGITNNEHYFLKIGVNGSVSLFWKHDQYTGGKYAALKSGSSFSLDRAEIVSDNESPGSYEFIWILSSPRGILVGNQGLSSGTFFHAPRLSKTFAHPYINNFPVKPGPIEMGYNGGKWEGNFVPVWMPSNAYYQTPVLETSYPWDSNTQGTSTYCYEQGVYDWVDGELQWATTEPGSSTAARAGSGPIMGESAEDGSWSSRVEEGEYKQEYMVQIRSSKTIDETTGLEMWRSPFVYNLHFCRLGYVDSLTPINYTSIEGDDLSVSFSQDTHSPSGSVAVDNQTGGWAALLQDWTPRRVRVMATWLQKYAVTEEEES